MAHFGSSTKLLKGTGSAPENEVAIGPIQTDHAQTIAGSIYADQAGELLVQQTFDGTHWDISEKIAVVAKTAKSFSVAIIAPVAQVVFKNTSATDQTEMRLYTRTFTSGR